jgi:hypothetical protein
LAWPIELGGLSSGWGDAALRLWVWVWLRDEWLSSELGRGIRWGYRPARARLCLVDGLGRSRRGIISTPRRP